MRYTHGAVFYDTEMRDEKSLNSSAQQGRTLDYHHDAARKGKSQLSKIR